MGIASQKHRLCNALWMSNRRENLGNQPPNRCIDESSLLPLKLTIFFFLFIFVLLEQVIIFINRTRKWLGKQIALSRTTKQISVWKTDTSFLGLL